jgi:polysaccharide pyruvyl transferase WcaK-like protein
MVKVLITNHNSTNKGDTAILISQLHAMREFIPHVQFSIVSNDPETTAKLHVVKQYGAKIVKWIGPIREQSRGFKRLKWALSDVLWFQRIIMWALLNRFGINVSRFFTNINERELLQEYINADAIVVHGGGPLTDIYSAGFFYQYYLILISVLLKKPTIMYAQSFGPFTNYKTFDGIYKRLTKFLLNRTLLITLREGNSLKVLQDLGINGIPTLVTADCAFLMRSEEPKRVKEILDKEGITKERDKPLVGITSIYWRYPGSSDPYKKQKEYEKILAQVADYLVSNLNAKVVFIPVEVKGTRGDDRFIASKVYQLVKQKNNVKVILGEYTPEEVTGIIGNMDLLISTRLHSAILGSTMNVPAIVIKYDPKADGIWGKMLGQEKYICNIEDLNLDKLITRIDEIWSNRNQVKKSLEYKTKITQNKSLLNAKLAAIVLRNVCRQ